MTRGDASRSDAAAQDPTGIDEPHDVLAAEAFALPWRDERPHHVESEDPTGVHQPHDVLAAEAFALPWAPRHYESEDPTGVDQPHDVLAAEAFALPAAPDARPWRQAEGGLRRGPLLFAVAGLALILIGRRRR